MRPVFHAKADRFRATARRLPPSAAEVLEIFTAASLR